MMKTRANKTGQVWSWKAPGVAGIECLRAQAIIPHFGRHSHETYVVGVIEEGVGGNYYRGAAHYIPAGDVLASPEPVF